MELFQTVKILTNKIFKHFKLTPFWHTSTFTVPAYTMPNDDSIKMTHCNATTEDHYLPFDNDGGSGLEPSTLA